MRVHRASREADRGEGQDSALMSNLAPKTGF
jgi:hypothetical protein